ncbi:MAG: CotH kinase family protein [Janthinobacterium lividum]
MDAQGIVTIKPEFFHVDAGKNLILINTPNPQLLTQREALRVLVSGEHQYTLAEPVVSVDTRQAYRVTEGGSTYTAYFTQIPVLQISTRHQIVDTPSRYANFSLTDTKGTTVQTAMGIEIRGGFSQSYPKKSYELTLWTDTVGTSGRDIALLGMRTDNKWNLQALYNDPLRVRIKAANELWQDMNQVYYKDLEPSAKSGISLVYTEVFLNDQYQGIYALTERVDRKQLKLKKYTTKIMGELYKGVDWDGATTFTAVSGIDNSSATWSGFEYKEPSEQTEWQTLHDFVDFVVNSPDNTFYSQFKTRFKLENAVDYFIFLNLMRATDNTGKNIYIAKYKPNEPYFYVPWDLDGVLGNDWAGQHNTTTNDILTNGMYKRLMKDTPDSEFRGALAARWSALRATVLTKEAILTKIKTNNDYLLANNTYEREHLAWPAYQYDAAEETYPATWLTSRLAYLDAAFKPVTNGVLATQGPAQAVALQLYPNPASGSLSVEFGTGPYQIMVQDMSGKNLLQTNVASGRSQVSIQSLPAGLYLVRVKSATSTAVQKLVVN